MVVEEENRSFNPKLRVLLIILFLDDFVFRNYEVDLGKGDGKISHEDLKVLDCILQQPWEVQVQQRHVVYDLEGVDGTPNGTHP